MSGSTLFGAFFAEIRRTALKLSLREFCERNGLDAGNISRLERGKIPPPRSREILERYARALGLQESSDAWRNFFDLAATCRGELPADLMSDEEVVTKLPVLFRTLRGERVDEKSLKALITMIRGT